MSLIGSHRSIHDLSNCLGQHHSCSCPHFAPSFGHRIVTSQCVHVADKRIIIETPDEGSCASLRGIRLRHEVSSLVNQGQILWCVGQIDQM